MQHSRAVDGGPAGPEDDDYGPPDWFAAVAEPEPGPEPEFEPDPAPGPGPRPGRGVPPGRAGRRGAPDGASGPDGLDDALGLVSASELPTGRRRRRSALVEETAPGHPAGGGAAGHGGAAAPVSRTGPADLADPADAAEEGGRAGRGAGARRTRGRARGERAEGEGRKGARGARAAKPEESVDPEARARDICLRLLTGAAKSRKQLADALRRREIPDEVADGVLTRLEEVGLIDDAAFAQAWVESRHAVRGLSRRALAQELRTKGVAGDLVEQAVAQLDYDDETEAARALVERKLRVTRGLERQARTRRLVGVLARRGYSEGLAFRVVREVLDAEAADGGPDGEDVDGGPGSGWE
ncbi:regulatory protein RecX [Kitasatospora sp. NBC_01246]|uniref:regulatory protein RecX n=1 Tax=Kitasatospora sp. NBC_01246 TaxID=2903570 RepID=UPI003FA54615